jgi:hypothetical protein
VKAIFQRFLYPSVPNRGGVGLRPEISNVVSTAESRGYQIVNLVGLRIGAGHSVEFENLAAQRRGNVTVLPVI